MTLLIVDMQEYFATAQPILDNVISEVRRSKRLESGIIVLEYDRHELGRSLKGLTKELNGYPRKRFVSKSSDDGGNEVVREAKRARFNTDSWRVCGVNTCFCVLHTTETMQRLLPAASFNFVGHALNCNCYRKINCHDHLWKHSGHKKVRVI